jgi:CBS domain-containing protein
MSRYRDDRDDYRAARRDDDPRARRERGGYYGGRGTEPFDAAYDERQPTRRDPRDYRDERARDYRDEGARDYRDRDYSRTDFESGAVGRRGERYDYERDAQRDEGARRAEGVRRYEDEGTRRYEDRVARGYEDDGGRVEPRERVREDDDDREGRSLWEEGRDYFARRTRGGGGSRASRGRTARSHVRCRDIMTRDVTVATRDTTLEEVARMMRDEDTGVIPVVERVQNAPLHTGPSATTNAGASNATGANASNFAASNASASSVAPVIPVSPAPIGESPEARRINADVHGNGRLVGLITDRDIVVRALAEGRDARAARAEEIMTAEVHTAQPNDRVIDAVRKMGDKQVRRIPVVDRDGILRGIISLADVALETDDDRELAEALEEISSGQSFWNRIFG